MRIGGTPGPEKWRRTPSDGADDPRMDRLRGDFDVFPLPGVARFVASTGSTGVLRADMARFTGRLFFVGGELSYATTRDEDGTVADLVRLNSEPSHERRGRSRSVKWSRPVRELVRQQIAEVVLRIERAGGGTFSFIDGVTTRAYEPGTEERFDVDEIIALSEERRVEWQSIEGIVQEPNALFRLRPQLEPGAMQVTVDAGAWLVLAAVGDGASVGDLAERLGVFEFPAAKTVADLVRRGLLVAHAEEERPTNDARTLRIPVERDDTADRLG